MAVRVPSDLAPILTVMVLAGRFPVLVMQSSRGRKILTGRAVILAKIAAMTVYFPVSSLAPKPPPM